MFVLDYFPFRTPLHLLHILRHHGQRLPFQLLEVVLMNEDGEVGRVRGVELDAQGLQTNLLDPRNAVGVGKQKDGTKIVIFLL